jgi:hypothetical protein
MSALERSIAIGPLGLSLGQLLLMASLVVALGVVAGPAPTRQRKR